jgi:MinD-like ATPase involved in chromosome partitioning or flagellar assembly
VTSEPTYPIPPRGVGEYAPQQYPPNQPEQAAPAHAQPEPRTALEAMQAHTSGLPFGAPPPAPAPVVDPHPHAATDWTYVPRQPASAGKPVPAEWGWRGKVREMTGGLIKIGPGQDELIYRAEIAQIRATLPGSRTIAVANEKGGAGKTPTALILSGILSELRREAVVAWDVNELRGTLGRRAEVSEPPLTVTDVLAAAQDLARPDAEVGALSAFLRRQPEGNLVLASSEDGNAMRQIGHAECDIVRQLLLRRYGIVVCDTGNNAAAPNFLYTVDSADVLVIPTAPSDVHLEVARAMLRMLASRETTADLVSRAVLVVTSPTGTRLQPDEERWFAERIGRLVHVPADPVIESGGKLPLSELSEASRRAWTQVASAVIEAALAPSKNDRPRGRRRAPDLSSAPLSAGWIPVPQNGQPQQGHG